MHIHTNIHTCKHTHVNHLFMRKAQETTQGLTTALQDAISFTRSMTSWLKVVGQKTCDTRPRLHASWAVSFRPQNSISLA